MAIVCSKCADIDAIFGHGSPVVVEYLYLRGPGVYHGFDGDDKAAFSCVSHDLASPKFGTCGSSCIWRPVPWPTNWRTTE